MRLDRKQVRPRRRPTGTGRQRITHGIVNEVYYPRLDQPNIRIAPPDEGEGTAPCKRLVAIRNRAAGSDEIPLAQLINPEVLM